ncbi:uncharacterized protein LOC111693627 [Trichogramma pretiosum]|uniref:uncharacterized protein LOC111693627 n=1 Tax=Trichogramma pretiosum TaxID=7493 RepID=UPI000C7194BC|nr:uncharacterized protein LOC111693627 [Trichogramma pretiosum]
MEREYSEVIEELRRALRLGERIDESVLIEGIRYLENALSSILSRSKKHKYQSQLSHLLSIRARYEKRGSGLSDDELRIKWEDVKSAFSCRIRTGQIVNFKHKDAAAFLEDAFTIFVERINEALDKHSMIKVNAELAAEYMTLNKDGEFIFGDKYFNTKNEHISQSTDLGEWFTSNVQEPILKQMEEFEEEGSGWALSKILHLLVNINKYNPSRVGSYIPLPDTIAKKEACVNVKNFDDFCFKWAILAALYSGKRKNKDRVEQYKKFENELNFSGIEFPMKLKDEKHVHLLMIQDRYDDEDSPGDDDEYIPINYHYVWIKNLSRLVSSQLSNHHGKKYICDRCLHYFHSSDKLTSHEEDCSSINKCKVLLPNKNNNKLTFMNYSKKEWVPFVIYADFECVLKPVAEARAYSVHEAFSCGLYLKCNFDDVLSEYRCYRKVNDDDMSPSEWFAQNLQDIADKVLEFFDNPKPMCFTSVEKVKFEKAEICHICKRGFTEKDIKVRDHSHFTGEYRGAAHSKCNINYRDVRFVPVIFHNLSGYDSHLFIREVATGFPGRVWVLPQTKERYISFVKFMEDQRLSFRFIDSFKFMASSLDKLAKNLKQQPTLRKVFGQDYNGAQIDLLTKKGVFPYEYISSLEKLQETALPPPEQFYSSLTDSDISTKDYEHAKEVWDSFKISNLGEYSDLYLKTDVILLVEVFENFRKTCHEAYELDPAHYYTLPGYSWDAMLLYTQVELELLTDVDMLLFVEKGIRGGVSQCCSRYSEANNRYMGEDYNPEKEDVYLMYYDINNLYGWAMAQNLPYGGFEWSDAKDYHALSEDSEYGYILEVDLEYPESLHDSHKDLPLCPEHACPPGSKQRKLLTTLNRKHKYVIHYRSLQQAVRLGVRVTKVHRALKFKQGPWLKSYIDLNTEKRKNSNNDFEKQQYKLCNNAIFGKTMENVRKRIDVKLVSSWDGRYEAEAQISKPNFHSRAIFDENLVAIQLSKTTVTIDKPVYVGFSILDISKTQLYRFHYDFMRDRFGSNCKVLYTDTDSLVYEIRGQNVYEVMKHKDNINEFDTFDYEKDNPFGMPLLRENSKKIGLMKDELCGKILRRFCGLRSKMYSVDIQNGGVIKKIKGIKSSVVKNTITFDDYLQCLRENTIISREQHNIRSRLHVLRSEKEKKIALSPHDDKRYLVPGTFDTLPWGHKDIASEPPAKKPKYN